MEDSGKLREEIRAGLLRWYDFVPGSKALCVTGESGFSLEQELRGRGLHVMCRSVGDFCQKEWVEAHKGSFRYIVSVASLECVANPVEILQEWRRLLCEDGCMLLGMNNRFGLRYFCGDRAPYTNRVLDGIENLWKSPGSSGDEFPGRMYNSAELKSMLGRAGWNEYRFYSVLPALEYPMLLYAENFLPNEDLGTRMYPIYRSPDSVFMKEETLYASLTENGMLHAMANAYLIECSPSGVFSDVHHVTCSMERGRENALLTVIRDGGVVERRVAWPEGQHRLEKFLEHGNDLGKHGIDVVEMHMEQGRLVMPYVEDEVGQVYLKRLLQSDKEEFLLEMDHFRDLVLKSSEHEREDLGDGEGVILRRGYVDMVPLNSFRRNGTFVFYDQEFCVEHLPANAILIRVVQSFYFGNPQLEQILPPRVLMERYGLTLKQEKWERMAADFMWDLRKGEALQDYRERHQRKEKIFQGNRCRMNFSEKEYQKRFVDTFENIEQRNLILFGSGRIAKRFLDSYGKDYSIYAVIDNDEGKWGASLDGVEIQSPMMLEKLQIGTYYVLICIKDCMPIMEQLENMGVFAYCVFEPSRAYIKKRHPIVPPSGEKAKPKKFHVGYVAGVFDLFHIGHLNLFKRAKEQCDYLIVGVVTDRQVREGKKTEPFIPFEERMEIVKSCRYVDEVVEIPFDACETWDAWRMFHFDVQFSGSDYEHDEYWMKKKEFLEKHGATMAFFPYTKSTSSTKLKMLVDKRLC